jgi:glycosyltransferase involved in cell wall biosynthesis
MPKKILFFIESLRSGGKERRMIELLHYLKSNTDYEMHVVTTEEEIHYKYIHDLDIPVTIMKRRWIKKDPSVFVRFYKIARAFNPDIIHAWGTMTTFYAIPSKILLQKPLLTNLIADAKKDFKSCSLSSLFFKTDCFFSDLVIANSNAGLIAYGIKEKKKVLIYNGVRLERFDVTADKNEIRKNIGVKTRFVVIMVASMSKYKDYDLFLEVAKHTYDANKDITFVAAGDGDEFHRIQKRCHEEHIQNTILLGKRDDAENLIYASDIGILCTYSEGISNSIIEYMALGKPVVTTDQKGGSKEIIEDGKSGYIVERNAKTITSLILKIIADENLRNIIGEAGQSIINSKFTIERMGKEYVNLYKNCSHSGKVK